MKSKKNAITMVAVLVFGFGLACTLGMGEKSIDITEKYRDSIVTVTGENAVYSGISEEDLTIRDLIYTDGVYDYYLDPSEGNVTRICLKNSRNEGIRATDMEAEAKEIFNSCISAGREMELKSETEESEGAGWDVLVKGYLKEEPTGDEVLVIFDEEKRLTVASIMVCTGGEGQDKKLTEGEAAEIAMNQAESNTLNGQIDGSQNAEKVTFEKVGDAKKTYWQGRWYWDVELEAYVDFSDRGTVHKSYDVRVDMETGEVVDTAWTLE